VRSLSSLVLWRKRRGESSDDDDDDDDAASERDENDQDDGDEGSDGSSINGGSDGGGAWISRAARPNRAPRRRSVRWLTAVHDEAHFVKNGHTLAGLAMAVCCANAEFVVQATGTP
jgi:hypothetical protein